MPWAEIPTFGFDLNPWVQAVGGRHTLQVLTLKFHNYLAAGLEKARVKVQHQATQSGCNFHGTSSRLAAFKIGLALQNGMVC